MGADAWPARAAKERERRFRDIRTSLTFGVDPQRIADEHGITTSSLHRQAVRWGATDIAEAFRLAATRERKARQDARRRAA